MNRQIPSTFHSLLYAYIPEISLKQFGHIQKLSKTKTPSYTCDFDCLNGNSTDLANDESSENQSFKGQRFISYEEVKT